MEPLRPARRSAPDRTTRPDLPSVAQPGQDAGVRPQHQMGDVVPAIASNLPPEARGRYDPSRVVKAPTRDSNGNDLRWAGRVEGGRNWQKRWKQVGHGRHVAQWNDEGPAEPPQLRAKSPQAKYRDEDKKFGWREQANPHLTTSEASDVMTTRYERDESNALAQGRMGDTSGEHGFVQDSRGSFHLFDPGRVDVKRRDGDWNEQRGYPTGGPKKWEDEGTKIRATHHTTPVEGGPVASAGMIQTNWLGKVEHVSDQSGHYIPEGEYTAQGVHAIHASEGFQGGEDNYRNQVRLGGYDRHRGQGKVWIGGNQEFHQDNLELPADAFLQSTGNERQSRLKATLNRRISQYVPRAPNHVKSPAAKTRIAEIRREKAEQERARQPEALLRSSRGGQEHADGRDALVAAGLVYAPPYRVSDAGSDSEESESADVDSRGYVITE